MRSIGLFVLAIVFTTCNSNKTENQLIILRNEYIKVVAKKNGAELISVKLLEDNTEYLWQGDSITWSDHAIVQFPIVGNLKQQTYLHNSESYQMMSHGFARVSDFEIIEKSANKVVFQLQSNVKTKALYPFDFLFKITYRLKGKSIEILFEVINTGDDEMLFSLGYHPGFNWPLNKGEKREDYFLEFSHNESSDRLLLKDNLIDTLQLNYFSNLRKLPLSKSIFKEDALILKDLSSTSISLKNKRNTKSVKVNFGKVPYLGIWSPLKNGDFVCIEPWHGIADSKRSTGILEDKEGIIKLPIKKNYKWQCSITIN